MGGAGKKIVGQSNRLWIADMFLLGILGRSARVGVTFSLLKRMPMAIPNGLGRMAVGLYPLGWTVGS
jgi:hypothetical protein